MIIMTSKPQILYFRNFVLPVATHVVGFLESSRKWNNKSKYRFLLIYCGHLCKLNTKCISFVYSFPEKFGFFTNFSGLVRVGHNQCTTMEAITDEYTSIIHF